MANTKAWIKPTNTSNAINGTGTTSGIKNIITTSSVFPAKIFPNKRNENDTNRASSEINSKIPKANPANDLKLINLPVYLNKPMASTPEISIVKKAISAKAIVMFRSVAGGYNMGVK